MFFPKLAYHSPQYPRCSCDFDDFLRLLQLFMPTIFSALAPATWILVKGIFEYHKPFLIIKLGGTPDHFIRCLLMILSSFSSNKSGIAQSTRGQTNLGGSSCW
jgi:hypothetical protein